MIILDATALLTRKVSVDDTPSEIRLWSLLLVYGIGARLETKHLKVSKLSLKKPSMLIGLKVSTLERRCVIYRPELTRKWRSHRNEILSFWNAKIKYIKL